VHGSLTRKSAASNKSFQGTKLATLTDVQLSDTVFARIGFSLPATKNIKISFQRKMYEAFDNFFKDIFKTFSDLPRFIINARESAQPL